MDKKVLVAYASKYGATREIAERIGGALLRTGLPTDVYPVNGIRDLSPYGAVILGSAIYVGKWQKEAVAFLQTHEKSLADRPVWLFCSGPTGEGDPVDLIEGKVLPEVLKPVVSRIKPHDIAVFHGFINPDKMNSIEKWSIKNIVKKPFGDFRDWNSIVNWGANIAAALKEADLQSIPV